MSCKNVVNFVPTMMMVNARILLRCNLFIYYGAWRLLESVWCSWIDNEWRIWNLVLFINREKHNFKFDWVNRNEDNQVCCNVSFAKKMKCWKLGGFPTFWYISLRLISTDKVVRCNFMIIFELSTSCCPYFCPPTLYANIIIYLYWSNIKIIDEDYNNSTEKKISCLHTLLPNNIYALTYSKF